MQGTHNSAKHDVLSITTKKYAMSQRTFIHSKTYYRFFAQFNNYIIVLIASKTTTNN